MRQFEGTMVALVTPFKDQAVDYAALERLVDFQLEAGTDGLVLCGTTAESPTLTEAEQTAIVKLVVKRVKGACPIIVGTGTNCTERTLQRSRQAATLGADGLMIVTPYYSKPTQAGLYAHFAFIAQRVEVPIILYNIPGRCAREIAESTICRLHQDYDNIVAVKHATGAVTDALSLHVACPITILSGDDPLTLPLMMMGARGVISVVANLYPARVKAITDACLRGDYGIARELNDALYPIARVLLGLEPNPIPIKTAMALAGYIQEEFRLPMCSMQPENRSLLQETLAGITERK